ncbi:putative ATP-dependent RNA helicase [Streptomyces sp. NBRC 110611]|uniref:DEAD/DEAH box helicase n=1 Tax=Streptomyces sp. NBRC 110611 TaxID=1621259 RepID=UPI000834928F|nr:DEAD/DEAH box helicase [Streptomyces sp. NBRC 110611]GAU66381.1 putative ATP-dependent RNA helicase [Streptomyces sp. NBRC 110611]
MSISTEQSVVPALDPQVEQPAAEVTDADVNAADVNAVAVETEAAAKTEADDPAVDTGASEAEAEAEAPTITFADLGLPEGVVRKLAQNGVTTPFPIQAATIPDALAGKDILGRGRTGSGKTLSFGLPTLARLAGGHTEKKKPRAVLLTPTRELAMQVADSLQPYGDVLGLKMKVVCGGTSMGNQIYALERGVDILVATPGRLRDIINRGACSLEAVEVAVLDEADQMSDLGFLPEVTELLDQVPEGGQRMLFSATMENEISTLVKRYLTNPVSHEVDSAQGNVTTMTHHVLVVKPKDKAPVTAAIAARKGRTIIFVRTQLGADRIAEQLVDAGVKADALHGGMTQGARTRVLADFKDGYVNALVATDVAARGIHVDGIDLVLNVDPAGDHKDYLHRSGRTARAGRSGTVVSLSLPHQRRQIFRLMEDAGVDASRHIVSGSGAFDEELARITGARSLTEVQAESVNNSAKQAEREVNQLTRELERLQRRATELREEADRLTARAARERGEDPATVLAAAAEQAESEAAAEAAAEAAVPAQATSADRRPRRDDRRDDRGNFERRDRRDDRRDDRGGFRRDDRGDRGGFGRDRRDDRAGGRSFDRDRRDDRGGFRRDDRGDRGGFGRDERRDDRGGFGRDRRDDRAGGRSFDRDRRDDRGGFRRDDRGDRAGGRSFDRDRRDDRRDDRGGFRRDERRDDRGGFGRDRGDRPSRPFGRDDRAGGRSSGGYRSSGGDRPFNRDDRSGGRPSSGHRPYGRRDDHRGAPAGSYGRRDDKPRWKRNG